MPLTDENGARTRDAANAERKRTIPKTSTRLLKRRWVRLLTLTVLGAVVFEMILPLAWHYAKQIQLPYSPLFLALTTWLAVLLLVYLVSELADYAGDNAYAVRARDAARAWLDERFDEVSPWAEQPGPPEEAE